MTDFFRSMSQLKAYNFLNHRKIAIQHFILTVKSAQTRAIYRVKPCFLSIILCNLQFQTA